MPVRSQPLARGDQAFDVTALAHNGQRILLSQFDDEPVVIYFCAHLTAAPCAELAAHLTRSWLQLNYTLSMVFAVTAQNTLEQREWAIEHESPFLFLADPESKLRAAFGVAPDAFASYLLDKERRVVAVWTPPQPGAHAQQIEAALREAGLLHEPYPL
jgi:peroxiredoxin